MNPGTDSKFDLWPGTQVPFGHCSDKRREHFSTVVRSQEMSTLLLKKVVFIDKI